MLHVSPYKIVVAGENSFLRLGQEANDAPAHWASHWRVFWSDAGSGHALFLDSVLTEGVAIFSDNEEVARLLQRRVEPLLYMPFSDTDLPIISATFDRDGCPPNSTTETVAWDGGSALLVWSELQDPFSFSTEPGFHGRALGHQTTFFSAGDASLIVNGRKAEGKPWPEARGDRPCTSACLAWCETWFEPDGSA